jgi:hypothetical protein
MFSFTTQQIFPHHAGAALPNAPILSSTFGAVIAREICSSEPIRTNANRPVGHEKVVLATVEHGGENTAPSAHGALEETSADR